jgi:Arc/MetJ-type ribon-helix-helix transcriptional regulator
MYMTLHRKARLTVTVDAELVAAANAAVARGESDSVSAYVNTALAAQSGRERRLAAMAAAIADYEAEFGKITEADLAERHRQDRANAIRVRHGKVHYPDGTVTDADGNILEER